MKPCPRCEKGQLRPLSKGTCWYCSNYASPVSTCQDCGLIIDATCLARAEAQRKAQTSRDLGKEFRPGDEEGSSL